MPRRPKEFNDDFAPPAKFDENTFREYAATHTSEQISAYLDGVKDVYRVLDDMVSPPFNDGTVWSEGDFKLSRKLREFVTEKRELLKTLTIEYQPQLQSPLVKKLDTTIQPD